jgi:hypothetical protein
MTGGLPVKDADIQDGRGAGSHRTDAGDDPLNHVRDLLRGLRYGSVNIIVQDGVIIQIDRTEKKRLQPRRAVSPGQ